MVRESLQKSLRPLAVGAMCNSFIWLATMLSAQKVFAQFTPLGHEGNDGDITTSPVEGLVPGNWQTFAADI